MEGAPFLKVYERGTFPSIQGIYKGTGLDLGAWPPCKKKINADLTPPPGLSNKYIQVSLATTTLFHYFSLRNKNFCLTILRGQVAFFIASPQLGGGSQLPNLLAWQRTWHQNDWKTNPDQQVADLFGLYYKSSWSCCLSLSLSLSLSPPFFSFTNVSNNV